MKKYMVSLTLLLSIAPVHAVEIPASVKQAAAYAENVAHTPIGREALHQIIKDLTKEEILVLAQLSVITADDVAQVTAAVVSQLRDANRSHDVKEVAKTAAKTFAREKALSLVTAGLEKGAEKANISRPDFIARNGRLNYVVSLLYKETMRTLIDSQVNKLVK